MHIFIIILFSLNFVAVVASKTRKPLPFSYSDRPYNAILIRSREKNVALGPLKELREQIRVVKSYKIFEEAGKEGGPTTEEVDKAKEEAQVSVHQARAAHLRTIIDSLSSREITKADALNHLQHLEFIVARYWNVDELGALKNVKVKYTLRPLRAAMARQVDYRSKEKELLEAIDESIPQYFQSNPDAPDSKMSAEEIHREIDELVSLHSKFALKSSATPLDGIARIQKAIQENWDRESKKEGARDLGDLGRMEVVLPHEA